MRKFVLSVLVSIIMAIGLVSARPLVINADTWSDHLTGITLSYQENIVTFTFDTHVLGSFVPEIKFRYSPNATVNTIRPTVKINGTQVSYVIYNDYLYDVTVTKYSSSLQVVSDLDLSDVITILSEMYDNQEEILDQLELIYGNTETLTKMRQWNIPWESFYANSFVISNIDRTTGYEFFDFAPNNYFNFPVYRIQANKIVTHIYVHNNSTHPRHKIIFIFGSKFDPITTGNANSILGINSNLTVESVEYLNTSYFLQYTGLSTNINFYKIVVVNNAAQSYSMDIKFNDETLFIPIYLAPCNNIEYFDVSTEFALQWGLKNSFLNDVHIVAQGTQQSSGSSSDLEDSAQEYGELADDVLGLEDDLGSGFSSSLNNVPTTFNFSTQFGNKFLHSATWVRTQFETLTTNTPFGALITFSLVLGLALLLVGRRLL